ncbi:SSI family serine proteinase inhibitor [Streptomyces sp. NBC_01803]|uniref:SSI family serine proteinase inhibitor n=1 Tax=Streptomyces sp. NBC_01803 TaxID=2975946 RepID=UPI002DDC3270|nr:SSI family serine proteinase inhibitor [Streptomyces sp. NBC_01803]WSA45400.1 subtilase-type protease inhibitor [Streptomyces sp. NBC_01803]
MPYKSLAAVLALAASAALPTAAAADDPGADTHRLEITVTGTGETDGTFELTCLPAGGDHPQAAEACAAIDRAAAPFEPVAADTLCTYVYGGPATATIEGVWQGEPVQAEFSRSDGCEIARWNELVPALPALS